MRIIPRIYQEAAITAALKGLRGSQKRALVVMATALGKTLTAALIAQRMPAKRMLFLVHNNFILAHAMSEFSLVFDEMIRMAVYNGSSKNGAHDADIVFATWQTMGRNLKRWARDHFDLVIVDEAHHTEAETYAPVARYFTGAKLGITATPDREDEADIRAVFGPEVVNVTLEEAISRDWLPRIEYRVVTDETLDEQALQAIAAEIRGGKRFTMDEVNRRIFITKRDAEIAEIINGHEEKAVVFCASIRHAERMHRSLTLSATFHSGKGKSKRDSWTQNCAVLDALNDGSLRRVCAVNAFNEGVNVPTVGLVAFCRVTDSVTVFRQQLGRGLRPGKEKLIVLDFVGNLERIRLILELTKRITGFTEPGELLAPGGSQRKPFEVSGAGFEFTFSQEIVDLMQVLEHCERGFYPTWQEASAAAIKLGISSQRDYDKRYREDERLPSDPHDIYSDFPSFLIFLGKKTGEFAGFYPTWQEASAAAIKLGISRQQDYNKRYRVDERLPSDPHRIYPDFPTYPIFFGKKFAGFYPTWQEASAAAIKLGILGRSDYNKRYREDERLPSAPNITYPDFPGFLIFLGKRADEFAGFYPTWQEASAAAIKLGISSQHDYKMRHQEDERLPSNPYIFYPDFPSFLIFLGKKTGEFAGFYPTWQEASAAAIKLGIFGWSDYNKRYREDERLPSKPEETYPDFPGFSIFLGTTVKNFYPTWQEAGVAAIKLGIMSYDQYKKRYREDERLPSAPNITYPDFPGYTMFLNKR